MPDNSNSYLFPTDIVPFPDFAKETDYYNQDDPDKELIRNHYLNVIIPQIDTTDYDINEADLKRLTKEYIAQQERSRSEFSNLGSGILGAAGRLPDEDISPIGEAEQVDNAFERFSQSALGGFARSYTETGEGAGLLIDRIEKELGTGTEFGLNVSRIAEEATNAINSEDLLTSDRPDEFMSQVGSALGQLAGFILGGGVLKVGTKVATKSLAKEASEKIADHTARVGLIGAGGSIATQAMVDDYLSELPEDQAIDQDTLNSIAVSSMFIGALDSIVPGEFVTPGFLGKLSSKLLKDSRIRNALKTGLVEGATEAGQSALMNLVAKATYDELDGKQREVLEGSFEEGAVGGTAGLILGFMSKRVPSTTRRTKQPPPPEDTPTLEETATLEETPAVEETPTVKPHIRLKTSYELSDVGGEGGVTVDQDTDQVDTLAQADQTDTPPSPAELRILRRQQAQEAVRTGTDETPTLSTFDRVRQKYDRYVRSGGELADNVKSVKSEASARGALREVEKYFGGLRLADPQIREGVTDLQSSIKKDSGRTSISEQQVLNLDRALKGDGDAITSLTSNVRNSVIALRNQIDSNSEKIVQRFERMIPIYAERVANDVAVLGEKQAAKGENQNALNYINRVMKSITNSEGSYVHRTYLANIDKDFRESLPDNKEIQRDARNYLANFFIARQQRANQAYTQEDVNSYVEAEIQKIIGTVLNRKTDLHATNSEALLINNVDALNERQAVPAPIRKMLGEVKNPLVNYASTIKEQNLILQSLDLADSFVRIGLEQGFVSEKPNAARGLTHKLTPAGNNPATVLLSSYYMPEHVARGLADQFNYDIQNNILKHVTAITGLVKLGKTVYSPATSVRNWLSAIWFLGANGDMAVTRFQDTAKTTASILSGKAGRDYHKMLIKNGVIADGIAYQSLRDMARDVMVYDNQHLNIFTDEGSPVDIAKPGYRKLKEYNKLAFRFYQGADDFPKIMAFENMRSVLAKSKGVDISDPSVIEEAATRVRDLYPTYSKVNRTLKKLRGVPFSAPFISFPAEVMRISKNWVKYFKQDMASGDPVLQGYATRRALSLLATAGSTAYLGDVLANAFGDITDEDRELVKKAQGKYERGNHIIPLFKHDKNNYEILNMSRYNPYSVVTDAVGELLSDSNADVDDKIVKSVMGLFSPFMQADITAQAMFEALNQTLNDQSSGAIDKSIDAVKTVVEGVSPTAILQMKKAYDAAGGNSYYWPGLKRSPVRESAKLIGATTQLYNIPQQLAYVSREYSQAKRDASTRLNRYAKDPKTSASQVDRVTNSEVNYNKHWSRLLQLSNYLKTSHGWTDGDVFRSLYSGKTTAEKKKFGGSLSKDEITALLNNEPAARLDYPTEAVQTHINQLRLQHGNDKAAALESELSRVAELLIKR